MAGLHPTKESFPVWGLELQILMNPARYVAQVQISSVFENSVRSATRDIAELVLDYFPDESGKVKAVEYVEASSDVQDSNAVQR